MYFNVQKDFLCTNVYNWTCTLHKCNLQIFRPFIFQLGWLETWASLFLTKSWWFVVSLPKLTASPLEKNHELLNFICGIYQHRLLTLTSCSVPARRSWFRVPSDLSFNRSSAFFSQASRSFIVLCTLCYNQSNEYITPNYVRGIIEHLRQRVVGTIFFFSRENFISLRKNVFGANRLLKRKRANVNWATIKFEEGRKKFIFANS